MSDVSAVLSDADALLRQAASATGDQATELQRRAQASISSALSHLGDVERQVVGQAKRAALGTDHWVHEHPWRAIGLAAAVGLLIALVFDRR